MLKTKFILRLIFLIIITVVSIRAQWRPIGPSSNIKGMAVAGDTIYLSSHIGIKRSINNGIDWITIAEEFKNNQVRQIFTFKDKLLISSDLSLILLNRKTNIWKEIDFKYFSDVSTFLDAGDVQYIGTYSQGIFKSVDGGQNWEVMNNGLSQLKIYNINFIDGKINAITVNGLYECDIANNRWVLKYSKFAYDNVYSFEKKDDDLFVSTSSRNYYSNNSGLSWNEFQVAEFSKSCIIFKVIDNVLYALTSDNGVVESYNNGKTWSKSDAMNGLWVFDLVKVNDYLFANTYVGLYKKNLKTGVWSIVNTGISNSWVYALEGDNNNIYVTNYPNYTFKIDEDGNHSYFNNINISGARAIFIKDSIILLGKVNDTMICKSNDYGKSWKNRLLLKNYNSTITQFCEKDEKIYAINIGEVFVSSDYGDTWKECNKGFDKSNFKTIKNVNGKLLVGGAGGLYEYSTFKDSWTLINSNFAGKGISDICKHKNILFIGTNDGIYKSVDSAKSWTLCVNDYKFNSVTTLVSDSVNVYAGNYGNLIKSTDDGVTWSDCKEGLLNGAVTKLIYVKGKIYAAIQYAGVSVYSPFNKFNSLLISPPNSSILNDTKFLFKWYSVLNHKKYLLEIAKDTYFKNIIFSKFYQDTTAFVEGLNSNTNYYWRIQTSQENDINTISETYMFRIAQEISSVRNERVFSINPNPVFNSLIIKGLTNKTDECRIKIYDKLGRLLLNIQNINLNSEYILNLSELNAGSYTLEIESDSNKYYHTFIKIK